MNVDQISILLSTLCLKDINFILQNLDTLLHLSQVLTGGLDLTHVLVSRVLHLFIQSDERVQLEVCVLLLLRQVKNEKFFYLEFSTSFTGLSRSLRGCPCHFRSDGHQEVDLNDKHGFSSLHLFNKSLFCIDLLFELINTILANIQVETLLDKLTDIDHLIFLVVLQTMLKFTLLRGQFICHFDYSTGHSCQFLNL
mgnify:CR=1 FL=1